MKLQKILNKRINHLENSLFSWIVKTPRQLFRLFLFSSTVLFLPKMPYVNLFVQKSFVFFLILIFALLVYKVKFKYLLRLGGIFTLLGMLFVLFGIYEAGEILGNYLYGLTILLFFQLIPSVDNNHK
ncbi:hypothetical protein ISR94_02380 [Candidatus Microgenomates bacterium]|nr:hypothetical protein [Candidatus Microgenomates bacterium]